MAAMAERPAQQEHAPNRANAVSTHIFIGKFENVFFAFMFCPISLVLDKFLLLQLTCSCLNYFILCIFKEENPTCQSFNARKSAREGLTVWLVGRLLCLVACLILLLLLTSI